MVDSEKPIGVTVIAADEKRKGAFLAIRAATIKSTLTKTVQAVPPGTTQGAFPALERNIQDLPSKDFFLKTLDRPHYPDEVAEIDGEGFDARAGNDVPEPAGRPARQAGTKRGDSGLVADAEAIVRGHCATRIAKPMRDAKATRP